MTSEKNYADRSVWMNIQEENEKLDCMYPISDLVFECLDFSDGYLGLYKEFAYMVLLQCIYSHKMLLPALPPHEFHEEITTLRRIGLPEFAIQNWLSKRKT